MGDNARPDMRRALQLALAAMWLLDGLLQFQSVMFTKSFGQSLAATAAGNPWLIARPIVWDATLIEHHPVLLNAIFASAQLLLGLGIAFRPTLRTALAASIAWSLGVWWFGEGLGGVLFGAANPLTGAPGAVIIYALLAVVLWPAPRRGKSAFVADGLLGTPAARTLWSVLWFSFAYFALLPANRAPQALSQTVAGLAGGEPSWLAAIERTAASLTAGRGLAAAIAFAVAYAVVGACVWLPPRYARPALALALVVAVVIWAVGEAFGMILAGGATDPNSGPLLAILALAYWPSRTRSPRPAPALPARRAVLEGSDA